MTQSALLPAILNQRYRGQPVPRVKAHGASYAVARELNKIDMNLNQITHIANATSRVAWSELRDIVERLRAVLDKI